jgi:heptosyltransferase-2
VAPIYRRMREVARVVASPFRHGELRLRERFALSRRLAGEHYAEAVVLPNSLKSALVPLLAGIRQRSGFVGEARYGFLNQRHRLDRKALPLMVERFAQLAQAPGSPLRRPVPSPRLTSTSEQQARTLAALGLAAPARLAVLCPGAEFGPAKRWPAEYFRALAAQLAARGFTVWLVGSAKDRPIADAIADGDSVLNLCGRTEVEQAIDVIAMAALVVCNDSGLMHVAAALDRPLVAIFGSSSPEFTPPLSGRARVVRHALACSPCFQRQCPLEHLQCLRGIAASEVLAACDMALASELP